MMRHARVPQDSKEYEYLHTVASQVCKLVHEMADLAFSEQLMVVRQLSGDCRAADLAIAHTI